MGGCEDCNMRKVSCKHSKAICTEYDGTVNEDSTIIDVTCKSIEETTQDVYSQLGDIYDLLNVGEELGDDCLVYSATDLKTIIKKFEEEICDLKEAIAATSGGGGGVDTNITSWGLDFRCLAGECDTSIQTLPQLLQAIINKLCNLSVIVETGLDTIEPGGGGGAII